MLKNTNTQSAFLVAALAFLGLNLAFLIADNTNTKERKTNILLNHDKKLGSWWLTKAYLQRTKCPEIMLLGSSQMGAFQFADAQFFKKAVDYTGDRSAAYLDLELRKELGVNADAFVAAMPGALISDDLVIVKALCESGQQPRLFVLGISPRDLIDNTCLSVTGTEPFVYFSRAAHINDCIGLYCPKFWDRVNWLMKQSTQLPDLRGSAEDLASGIHPFFVTDRSTRAIRDIGQAPLFQKVEPGQLVLKPDENPVFTDNTEEYRARYKDPFPGGLNKQLVFLAKFMHYANEHDIRVLVVGMPLTPENQVLLPSRFWTFYRQKVARLCLDNNAHWVDLSSNPDFQHADYSDCVHLNGFGGMKLCQILAGTVSKCDDLVAALKPRAPHDSPKNSANQLNISQR